jgi:hypothetical protein
MDASHDPLTCSACGTVNPWSNEECRVCGAALGPVSGEADGGEGTIQASGPGPDKPESGPAATSDGLSRRTGSARVNRIWNIRWLLIGAGLFWMIGELGQFAIASLVIGRDPVLRPIVEDLLKQQTTGPLSKQEEKEIKEKAEAMGNALVANKLLVVTLVILLLVAPLLIAGLVGYVSRGVAEGAIAIALGMAMLLLVAQQALKAMLFVMVYAMVGAAGAAVGTRIRRKRDRETSNPKNA